MMEHHGGLPNTAGTESHFTPTYPLEVLNSANSPADEKVWELVRLFGFIISVRTNSI
jgi:hypothetical protein